MEFSASIDRSNLNLSYFNDDRIEFLSCLAPADLNERLLSGNWRCYKYDDVFGKRGVAKWIVYVNCHDAKAIGGTNYVTAINRRLRANNFERNNWIAIFDWYGFGEDAIYGLYAGSSPIREVSGLPDMSKAMFGTLNYGKQGRLTRLLGEDCLKPRTKINFILNKYTQKSKCAGVLDVWKSGLFTVPLAYFRGAMLPWEDIGCDAMMHLKELGGQVMVKTVPGHVRRACSAECFKWVISQESYPMIINDHCINYALSSNNKNNTKEVTPAMFYRAMHYQQVMRIARLENWPVEAPLWMALICYVYLERMSEYKNQYWLVSTRTALNFCKLHKLNGEEYFKMKDEVARDFMIHMKNQTMFTDFQMNCTHYRMNCP
jgi:hypothetical protein